MKPDEIAMQLRAQIPSSTDPGWLERMACEAEGRPAAREAGGEGSRAVAEKRKPQLRGR